MLCSASMPPSISLFDVWQQLKQSKKCFDNCSRAPNKHSEQLMSKEIPSRRAIISECQLIKSCQSKAKQAGSARAMSNTESFQLSGKFINCRRIEIIAGCLALTQAVCSCLEWDKTVTQNGNERSWTWAEINWEMSKGSSESLAVAGVVLTWNWNLNEGRFGSKARKISSQVDSDFLSWTSNQRVTITKTFPTR